MHERLNYIRDTLIKATEAKITLINPYHPAYKKLSGIEKTLEAIEYLKNDDGAELDIKISDDQEYCTLYIKAITPKR